MRNTRTNWIKIVLATGISLGYAAVADPATWVQDGGTLNIQTNRTPSSPSIALMNNTPYVTWNENNGTAYQVYVKHFNGVSWVQDGGTLNVNSTRQVTTSRIAIANGTPFVVWAETNGTVYQGYAKHWNGASWIQDGANLNFNGPRTFYSPDIAAINGMPYITWYESNGTASQIFVKHWNGVSWVMDGGTLCVQTNRGGTNPAIAGLGTTPYVAWYEDNGTAYQTYVKHYNGSSWVLDGRLNDNSTLNDWDPSIATSSTDVYVNFSESNSAGTMQLFEKHYNGASWTGAGSSLNIMPNQHGDYGKITIANGTPYIFWSEQNSVNRWELYVKHYNGMSWTFDGTLNVNMTTNASSPRTASAGDVPYVTWQEYN